MIKTSAWAITVVGLILILISLSWSPLILPRLSAGFESGPEGLGSDTGDDVVMDGRMALPAIAWASMDGQEPDDISIEDLEALWRNVLVRPSGTYSADTGELLFRSDQGSFSAEDSLFPVGGVEARDYTVSNEYLGRDATARFLGVENIFGRDGYLYEIDIDSEQLKDLDAFSSFGEEMEFSSLVLDTGAEILYSDSSRFVLDPRTSIPLDIDLDISVDLKMPDNTRLFVREEDVRYAEEEIWIESTTVPGRKEKVEVLKETVTRGAVDPEDENIARYHLTVVYYDMDTGERLSEDGYDEEERFLVDRTTYRYMTGREGTGRSGFYEFPVGRVERRDYPMWDDLAGRENIAEYQGMEIRGGMDVMVFRMITEDVEVDSGNAVLPIYPHPATIYLLDTVQEWYLDSRTGFMVDFRLEGTVKVASSGPVGIIEQEVATFEVHLPENTTSTLRDVADLYHDLVLPLSNKQLNGFSLQIGFTEEVSREFVDLAESVGNILDLVEFHIPLSLGGIGTLFVILGGITIFIFRKKGENNQIKSLHMNLNDIPLVKRVMAGISLANEGAPPSCGGCN